jgi:two-component system OmpR family sensor kinase
MVDDSQKQDPTQAESAEETCFFRQLNVEFLVHELKDPLSVIETNARLLMEQHLAQADRGDRRIKGLQRILRSSQKARAMLWDLLEVGRAESRCFDCRSFMPEPVLKQLLVQVVETHAPELFNQIDEARPVEEQLAYLAGQGIRLDVQPAATGLRMTQDETKFCQIAVNLFKNALSYRRRMVLILLACHHDRFTLSVRDDGPGVEAAHHELIFQRYRQVHSDARVARNGHGLGLAAARVLARTMGGDIHVESQLGQGALFRLELPIEFSLAVNPAG